MAYRTYIHVHHAYPYISYACFGYALIAFTFKSKNIYLFFFYIYIKVTYSGKTQIIQYLKPRAKKMYMYVYII